MGNKTYGLIAFLIGFSIMSFIAAITFMSIAKDLSLEIEYLEREGCVLYELNERK